MPPEFDEKPYAPACERNQDPILKVLAGILTSPGRVLEIGSGTGQHAVHMARHLPHLHWEPTDVAEHVHGIRLWVEEADLANLDEPVALDVSVDAVTPGRYDAVFSANVVHFVAWTVAESLLQQAARGLREEGDLLLYGPFNEQGGFTSEGNRELDAWVRTHNPDAGIKDRPAVVACARQYGLVLQQTIDMPANNRILHFRRQL